MEASLIIRKYAPPGEPTLFAFEPMIAGKYVKWTDNQAWRNMDNNTPHAFSHYTYCRSKGTLLIADLQGVAAGNSFFFTDPQVRVFLYSAMCFTHPRVYVVLASMPIQRLLVDVLYVMCRCHFRCTRRTRTISSARET